MKLTFSKKLQRQYKKLPNDIRKKFNNALVVFSKNPNDTSLNNHKLHGKLSGLWSIKITENIRAIYDIEEKEFHFVEIGTHDKLYK